MNPPDDFYANVKIGRIRPLSRVLMLNALRDNGTFFDIDTEWFRMRLAGWWPPGSPYVNMTLSQVHDAYVAATADHWTGDHMHASESYESHEARLSMKRFVNDCFKRANVQTHFEKRNWPTTPEEFDKKLQLFQKNGFLSSFLWSLPMADGFAGKLLKYKVSMRPHPLDLSSEWSPNPRKNSSEDRWDRHFSAIVNHFREMALVRAKKNAFAKLYYRCFARAFKDPLGAARKRENETAAADLQEHVSKCLRV